MSEALLWAILVASVIGAIAAFAALVLLRAGLGGVGREVREELRAGREEARSGSRELREEVAATLRAGIESTAAAQSLHLGEMTRRLQELIGANQTALERIRATVDQRIRELQEGNEGKLEAMRREASDGLAVMREAVRATLAEVGAVQQQRLEEMAKQLKELIESDQAALERIRTTVDGRVRELQEGNEKKLEEMRRTVDEKLQDTLERRLGESFKLVGDRLEAVHKGLGEMQTLATGVGDLKRVLTNVKVRGTWAEVQLGALLEQLLTPEQFARNVAVSPGSAERVEFAVRLPGPRDDPHAQVWLPIDSKFPQEDYLRLQAAAERGDAEAVQAALDGLARAVRLAARDIRDRYVQPPATTDFAIMFLATEGLYAEVLRQPALVEELQRVFRVVVAGPTTLAAILSSLRMGFQTLAIEQRASEVWRILGAVKTEFGKFGAVLEKVKRQLHTASNTIDETGKRSRAMERRLKVVEQLPGAEAAQVLGLPLGEPTGEVEPGGGEGDDLEV